MTWEILCIFTEEWCKILKKVFCFFKNDKNLVNFDPSTLKKVLKMCTLVGPFLGKYVTFDLKNYRGVIFYDTEVSCKVSRNTD